MHFDAHGQLFSHGAQFSIEYVVHHLYDTRVTTKKTSPTKKRVTILISTKVHGLGKRMAREDARSFDAFIEALIENRWREERAKVKIDIAALQWGPVKIACGVYQLRLSGVLQYIGCSKNVARRIREQRFECGFPFDEAVAAYVPFDQLYETERAAIQHFKPPLNVVGLDLTDRRKRRQQVCSLKYKQRLSQLENTHAPTPTTT
jgi:hypothetical protein